MNPNPAIRGFKERDDKPFTSFSSGIQPASEGPEVFRDTIRVKLS